MRKHFLLLFLMAILPLAGWAANFSTDGSAVVDDIPYGDDVTTAKIHFTLNGIEQTAASGVYKWEGKYYTDAEALVELAGNPQAGGVYYIKVVPNTAANNGECIAEVTFVKAPLTVAIKNDAFFVKSFLEAKTNLPATLVVKKAGASGTADVWVTGLKNTDTPADVLSWSNVSYSYANETANATATATDAVDNGWLSNAKKNANKINFTGFTVTSTNYDFTFEDRYMKIKQIALTGADFVTEAAVGKFTVTRDASYNPASKPAYTGAAQNLAYAIQYKYGTGASDVYVFTSSDYSIKYRNAGVNYTNAVNALAYTPVVSFKANANFSGDDIDLSSLASYTGAVATSLNYEIAKKNLYVLLNTNTKAYDGAAFLTADDAQPAPTFNYSSLVGQDAGKEVLGLDWNDLEANTSVTLKKDQGTYSIKFKAAAFTGVQIHVDDYTATTAAAHNAELPGAKEAGEQLDGDELTAYNASPNKTVNLESGVALTAAQAAAYNATLAEAVEAGDPILVDLDVNYTPVGVAADWTITRKAIAVTAHADYPGTDTSITYGDAIPDLIVDQENALVAEQDGVIAAYKATVADELIVGNNNITVSRLTADDYVAAYIAAHAVNPEAPTPAEIAAAEDDATVKLAAANALLDNYNPTVTPGTLVVEGVGLTIIPNIAASMAYGTTPNPTYAAFNSNTHAPVALTHAPTYLYRKSTQAASAATTTVPKEVGNYIVSIDEDGTLAPENGYASDKITYEETPFEITKKHLDLTVADQIVVKKDSKTVFLAKLASAEDSWSLDDGQSTEYGETLSLQFSLNEYNATTNPTGTVVVTSGKIMSKADGVVLDANGYIGNAIKVQLTGTTAGNYDITGYTVGKLKITEAYVADLAKATIIETITDAAANGSNYDVTISGRKLNADKWNVMVLPFAVKPLDFCNTVDQYAVFNTLKSAENGNVKFGLCYETIPANQPFLVKTKTEVDFDYLWDDDNNNATPKVKKYVFEGVTFVNAEPKQTDVAGAEFIGTFAGKTIEDDSFYAMQGGVFKHFTEEMELGFLRAYIVLTNATPGQEARFFVEEPGENGTTAIKELNIDTMKSVSVDGWYTLNGVKLQSIPTEKGVYINNGKKVVIK